MAGLRFAGSAEDDLTGATLAFDGKPPVLPAIGSDGTIAYYDYTSSMPEIPQPMDVVIAEPTGKSVARLPLLASGEVELDDNAKPPPAMLAKLHERAAAVVARLRGYRSLDEVAFDASSPKPIHIGDLVLDVGTDDVTLSDARGGVLSREHLESFDQGTRDIGTDHPVPCTYEPFVRAVDRDPVQRVLYLQIWYGTDELCAASPPRYLVWSELAPPGPSPDLIAHQFDAIGRDAAFATTPVVTSGMVTTIGMLKALGEAGHAQATDVAITVSRDGNSAWASTAGSDVSWRASDVLAHTPQGWRIAALAWTVPVGNADADREAKTGKLAAAKLAGEPGDASLRDAFGKLVSDGVDATAAARGDLVAIGSGPGERTVGGATFARAWNAFWKGKVAIVSSVARALPSGTTGWVAATITRAKPGYQLPYAIFCVFDKAADGTWSLVHIHFAS